MAKTIGFDDIDTSGGPVAVASGYKHLDWYNMYTFNPDDYYTGSGYNLGRTSGENVAYNGYADPSYVYLDSGTFTFKSVEMTAAWDSKLTVEVVGYDSGGNVIDDKIIKLDDTGPKMEKFNWDNVSYVEFISQKGKADPNQSGSGNHIVFDDFQISNIVSDAAHVNTAPAAFHPGTMAHHAGDLSSMASGHILGALA